MSLIINNQDLIIQNAYFNGTKLLQIHGNGVPVWFAYLNLTGTITTVEESSDRYARNNDGEIHVNLTNVTNEFVKNSAGYNSIQVEISGFTTRTLYLNTNYAYFSWTGISVQYCPTTSIWPDARTNTHTVTIIDLIAEAQGFTRRRTYTIEIHYTRGDESYTL